jgi:prepilin-type N-terminal cleavage/methylation domain-containing protein
MHISTIQTDSLGKTNTGNLHSTGFSLVELMITIAIVSILTGIAIPLYNGYIREGHLTTMRTTINGLRTVLEDFRLDNGSYGATGDLVGVAAIDARFNWDPSGDIGPYAFTVAVGTNSYDAWGTFNANTAIWVRCDNRLSNCCDADTPGATAVTNACP